MFFNSIFICICWILGKLGCHFNIESGVKNVFVIYFIKTPHHSMLLKLLKPMTEAMHAGSAHCMFCKHVIFVY